MANYVNHSLFTTSSMLQLSIGMENPDSVYLYFYKSIGPKKYDTQNKLVFKLSEDEMSLLLECVESFRRGRAAGFEAFLKKNDIPMDKYKSLVFYHKSDIGDQQMIVSVNQKSGLLSFLMMKGDNKIGFTLLPKEEMHFQKILETYIFMCLSTPQYNKKQSKPSDDNNNKLKNNTNTNNNNINNNDDIKQIFEESNNSDDVFGNIFNN